MCASLNQASRSCLCRGREVYLSRVIFPPLRVWGLRSTRVVHMLHSAERMRSDARVNWRWGHTLQVQTSNYCKVTATVNVVLASAGSGSRKALPRVRAPPAS